MAKKVKKKAKAAPKKPARKPKAAKKSAPKLKKKTAASRSKKTKPAKKAPAKTPAAPDLAWRRPKPGETLAGVVDDFYSHLGVITLTLQTPLRAGDRIHVRGHTTDIQQTVDSMQVDHAAVPSAEAGQGVGIKVDEKCRRGDYVYKAG